jgi:hypothetical protein
LTDRVVRYLVEGRKMQEISSKSRYRQFIPTGNNPNYYFVGKAGAIRSGRTASDSVCMTYYIHTRMKIWEAKLQKLGDQINEKLEIQS